MADIFSGYHLKNKIIKNRIVFPPTATVGLGNEDSFPTPKQVCHYEKIASGGVGMLITEAFQIDKTGKSHSTQIGIWDDKFVDGLKNIAKVCRTKGVVCMAQIQHGGIKALDDPISPSATQKARAMSAKEIEDIKNKFVDAAKRAASAGFDGIELHAAHGYLLSQFLSSETNTRTDAYGLDRTKILVDIIKRIKECVPPNFIVGVRFGGNDPDLETAKQYAKKLEDAGCDLLHISTGYRFTKPEDLGEFDNTHYHWIVHTGIEIKKCVSIPVIVVNSIFHHSQAAYIIENDLADFVAVCRGILVDNYWTHKIKTGEPIQACLGCKKCLRFQHIDACALNGI